MTKFKKRKCLHCKRLFTPDAKNHRTQRYCRKEECRKASKAASQKKWLSKEENKNYFRGRTNVERVQRWREANPGYRKRISRKKPEIRKKGKDALQELFDSKIRSSKEIEKFFNNFALQDLLKLQVLVIVGLISVLVDSTLQDPIATAVELYHTRGQDILRMGRSKSCNNKKK